MDAGSTPWTWSWSLWMLLFVAVNAHAALACVRVLDHERRSAAMRRRRCVVRKRSRTDQELSSTSGHYAVVFSPWTTPLTTRKRRRLVTAAQPRTSLLRRESLACPWPVHVSFGAVDMVGDSEKLVASWLAHPRVRATMKKLRDGLETALHDVLVSFLSFVLCAVAVFLLRRYSTLVVGVSVDLGAFSLEV